MKIQSGKSDAASRVKNNDENQLSALNAPDNNEVAAAAGQDFLGLMNLTLMLDDKEAGDNLNEGKTDQPDALSTSAQGTSQQPTESYDHTNAAFGTADPLASKQASQPSTSDHQLAAMMMQMNQKNEEQHLLDAAKLNALLDQNNAKQVKNTDDAALLNNQLNDTDLSGTKIKSDVSISQPSIDVMSSLSKSAIASEKTNSPLNKINNKINNINNTGYGNPVSRMQLNNLTPDDSLFSFKIANDIGQLQTKTTQLTNLGMQHDVVAGLIQVGQFIHHQVSDSVLNSVPNLSTQPGTETNYSPSLTNAAQFHADEINIQLLPATESLVQGMYNAHIKLYPPELGSVVARLRLDKNTASIEILAENNHVKGIIEANLAQLRDKFQQMDIHIQQIQVSVDNQRQEDGHKQSAHTLQSHESNDFKPMNKQSTQTTTSESRESNALVDTYV